MKAALNGYMHLVRKLIQAGADPFRLDVSGNGGLHYAAISGSVTAIKILVRTGCDLYLPNCSGETPFALFHRHNPDKFFRHIDGIVAEAKRISSARLIREDRKKSDNTGYEFDI